MRKTHTNEDILILWTLDKLIGNNQNSISKFKKKTMQEFEMTYLELLNYFLEIKLTKVLWES